jgi:hypothetical protein
VRDRDAEGPAVVLVVGGEREGVGARPPLQVHILRVKCAQVHQGGQRLKLQVMLLLMQEPPACKLSVVSCQSRVRVGVRARGGSLQGRKGKAISLRAV